MNINETSHYDIKDQSGDFELDKDSVWRIGFFKLYGGIFPNLDKHARNEISAGDAI